MHVSRRDRAAYKLQVQWAVETFTEESSGHQILAVVQTLKQRRKREDGTFQKLTESEVIKLVQVFTKEINREFYGNAYRRHRKKAALLCSLEGQEIGKRLHLNLAIALPEWITEEEGMKMILDTLSNKVWCRPRRTIKKAWTPQNWFRYMTKEHGTLLLEVCNFPKLQSSSAAASPKYPNRAKPNHMLKSFRNSTSSKPKNISTLAPQYTIPALTS